MRNCPDRRERHYDRNHGHIRIPVGLNQPWASSMSKCMLLVAGKESFRNQSSEVVGSFSNLKNLRMKVSAKMLSVGALVVGVAYTKAHHRDLGKTVPKDLRDQGV